MDTLVLAAPATFIGKRPLMAQPRDEALDQAAPERNSSDSSLWVRGTLGILWLIIGLVGALDTFLTVKYADQMKYTEENPLGKLLIALDDGKVSIFVGCKVAGTILALGLLSWIASRAPRRMAFTIMVPVALAQLVLVYYLFS